MNKLILFITLLSYSVVVSQSFMYMLSLKNTQLALDGSTYVEVRQLIDANMKSTFRYAVYASLLSSLLLVAIHFKTPSSFMFIAASIAFIALVIDILIMVKGSMPVNQIINTWSSETYPENWKEVREQWFTFLQYRQIANVTGFLSLLAGVVFSER